MYRSASLDSLSLLTSAASVLTSTANPAVQPSAVPKRTRRVAIIPTPNRPPRLIESDKIVSCFHQDKPLDSDNNSKHILLNSKQDSTELLNLADNQPAHEDHNKDEEDDNNLCDVFICENFVPFSGTQPVDQWLDQTEMLFNKFKISRKLRFKAIPLLVQGEAKRKYIKSRNSFTSFDDFYEFLLMNYDVSSLLTKTSIPVQTDNSTAIVKNSVPASKSTTDLKSNVENTTASTQMSQTCVHCSNKTDFNDTTKPNGEVSEPKLIGRVSSIDHSSLDPMIIDLRKVIVADFIRNPKIFRGNKDDVTKWLDEIDHLMQTAHVPECNRLDLISYSLRGDALQWYRNNKSMLTSWTVFVQEIKKAFTSSFCEEIAFKTLESYTQGQNQSVRNFYNEVLKLCKQADASMSESTKLKNLLNKVKPSIQLEVRKKTPKTTAEFLEYAKEVEELFQLSNINTDTDISYNSKPKTSLKNENSSNIYSSTYSENSNNNFCFTPQKFPY